MKGVHLFTVKIIFLISDYGGLICLLTALYKYCARNSPSVFIWFFYSFSDTCSNNIMFSEMFVLIIWSFISGKL